MTLTWLAQFDAIATLQCGLSMGLSVVFPCRVEQGLFSNKVN